MRNATGRVQFKLETKENYPRLVKILTEEFNASVTTTPQKDSIIVTGLFNPLPVNYVDLISESIVAQYTTLERMI